MSQLSSKILDTKDHAILSTNPPSCRILTISTSPKHAHSLISRIRALSKTGTSNETPPSTEEGTLGQTIPWTISNKYYTAQVHFQVHPSTRLEAAVRLNPSVPAIVLVWARGEPYAPLAERLSNALAREGCEPEVMLSVRVPIEDSTKSELEKEKLKEREEDVEREGSGNAEDDDDAEEILSRLGFELIDGAEVKRTPRGSEYSEETPGLPRLVDALSSIMWPSMQPHAHAVPNKHTESRLESGGMSMDWMGTASASESLSLSIGSTGSGGAGGGDAGGAGGGGRQGRLEREMRELERWLEGESESGLGDGAGERGDPWNDRTAVSTPPLSASPTTLEHPSFPAAAATSTPAGKSSTLALTPPTTTSPTHFGFDDDFTVFVSAPAHIPIPTSAPGEAAAPQIHHSFDALDQDLDSDSNFDGSGSRLGVSGSGYGGVMYRPLGSVSDFGEGDALGGDSNHENASEKESEDEDEDGDEDIPSKAEILATSARIFGSAHPGPPALSRVPTERPAKASTTTTTTTSEKRGERGGHGDYGEGTDLEHEDEEGGDLDLDLAPFDLSRVLGALRGMREEIAGLDDERERRRAAARVALGLVYGLQGEGGGVMIRLIKH